MATINDVLTKLELEELVGTKDDTQITGCYIGDLLSWVMSHSKEGQVWLTVMGNANVVAVAKLADIAGVILCENAPFDEDAKTQAEKNDIPVLRTKLPAYELSLKLAEIINN